MELLEKQNENQKLVTSLRKKLEEEIKHRIRVESEFREFKTGLPREQKTETRPKKILPPSSLTHAPLPSEKEKRVEVLPLLKEEREKQFLVGQIQLLEQNLTLKDEELKIGINLLSEQKSELNDKEIQIENLLTQLETFKAKLDGEIEVRRKAEEQVESLQREQKIMNRIVQMIDYHPIV